MKYMKLNIDSFTSLTGWNINSPSVIALNEFPEYIATLQNNVSLIAQFKTADTVKTLIKTFTSIDITEYEILTFSIWSQTKGKQNYSKNQIEDFNYKIKINDTDEYYLPVYETFTDVNINVKNVTSIDRIEITALYPGDDTIILSEMIVELEELPIDLLKEVKSHLEFYLNRNAGKGILLGSISVVAGETEIPTGDYDYLDRYAVILIDDGNNSETHQIATMDDNISLATLNDNFEGNTILHNYTDADIYITFPVYINPDERNIRLPGLCVWGVTADPILRTGKLDHFIESYKTDGAMTERIEGQVWKYLILLDCEARASSLIAIMTKAVRNFVGNEVVWINGRRHEIDFNGAPTEARVSQGIDIIPKVQFQITIEVIEQLAQAEDLVETTDITSNINISGVN